MYSDISLLFIWKKLVFLIVSFFLIAEAEKVEGAQSRKSRCIFIFFRNEVGFADIPLTFIGKKLDFPIVLFFLIVEAEKMEW